MFKINIENIKCFYKMSRSRYNDYYLVNDEDVEESIEVLLKEPKMMLKKVFLILLIGYVHHKLL